MAIYVVKRGDTLRAIAKAHGFPNFRSIYSHPNNQTFRQKRPNPDLIFPGDELFIPGGPAATVMPEPAAPNTPAPTPPPPPPPPKPQTEKRVIRRLWEDLSSKNPGPGGLDDGEPGFAIGEFLKKVFEQIFKGGNDTRVHAEVPIDFEIVRVVEDLTIDLSKSSAGQTVQSTILKVSYTWGPTTPNITVVKMTMLIKRGGTKKFSTDNKIIKRSEATGKFIGPDQSFSL